ncbi:hypothetical protein KCU98_g114, partial [Aureobasidium melanogenum]
LPAIGGTSSSTDCLGLEDVKSGGRGASSASTAGSSSFLDGISFSLGASVPGSFLTGVGSLVCLLASPSMLLKLDPNRDPPPCLEAGKSSFALPSPWKVEPSLNPPNVGSFEGLSGEESLLSGEAGFPEGLPNWNPVCLAGCPKTDADDLVLSVDCPNRPDVLGLSGVVPNSDEVFGLSDDLRRHW